MENTNNLEETELDRERNDEAFNREVEYFDKLQIANSGDFFRAIRYFSGFSIPLILTMTDISLSEIWAIWTTIGLFLSAILCSIIGHFFSDIGINKRREYIEMYWRHDKPEYRCKQHWTAKLGQSLDIISLICFLTGVVLLVIFVVKGWLIIKEV